MAVSVETLRAFGTRPIVISSSDGTFTGSLVQDRLSADSILVELAVDGDPGYPIVIAIGDITEARER